MNRNTAKAILRHLNGGADVLEQAVWIRGRMAEDEHGDPCPPYESCATRFCAAGAIESAALAGLPEFPTPGSANEQKVERRSDQLDEAYTFLNTQAWKDYGVDEFIRWNDEQASDRRQVVRFLRRAARRFAEEHYLEPA